MPFFSISSIGETYTYIYVSPVTTYSWYRVYVRLDDGSNTPVYDQWHNLTEGYYIRVGGLSPGTAYAVNVAYNTTSDASGAKWIGTETLVTNGTNPGGGGGGTTPTGYLTLSFNANGGSGGPGSAGPFPVTNNSAVVTMPSSSTNPTRSGYNFMGWSTSSTATAASYYPGVQYDNWWAAAGDSTQTLYAVWVKQTGTGKVHVSNGYGFDSYTPYIWYNGGWKKAVPYVWYNGGWKKGV